MFSTLHDFLLCCRITVTMHCLRFVSLRSIHSIFNGYKRGKAIQVERYGRPRVIVHAYIRELTQEIAVNCNDGLALSTLPMKMEKYLLVLNEIYRVHKTGD